MNTFKPISEFQTSRKCAECLKPAAQWRYKPDQRGGIDKSSKQPVCLEHGEHA